MKKIAVIFLIFLSILAHNSNAADKVLENMDDVTAWMTFYYANPDPDNIIPAIRIILNDDKMISDRLHNIDIIHFFAAALQADKSRLPEIGRLVEEPWGDKKEFISKIVEAAEHFSAPPPDNPDNIDCLWAEFMATGKEDIIKKMLPVLMYSTSKIDVSAGFWSARGIHSQETALEILQNAANYSLIAHAARDDRVYEIINNEINSVNTGFLKAKLKNILADTAYYKKTAR